ncbi:MAG: LysM domain-containing protein [Chloroflexota bacterium]|nr:LysM domain-containing protein [Chloroflexota bacterium]
MDMVSVPVRLSREPSTYIVRPGDNLFRIALRFNTTVEAIVQANDPVRRAPSRLSPVCLYPIRHGCAGRRHWAQAVDGIFDPNFIWVGQELVIP